MKRGRYAEKVKLGLVPHVYEKHSKRFLAGVQPPFPKVEIGRRSCEPRRGRHCLVAA